jgi:SAM-dependent methyltransferase
MPHASASPPAATDLPLESVDCYLCGSSRARMLVEDPPFRVLRCRECGLGYTSPRVRGEHLPCLYDDAYFSSPRAEEYGYSDYEADLPNYLRTFRSKAAWVHARCPLGSVLEVGCAGGAFLRGMADLGHEVHGLELSPGMVDLARRRLGLHAVARGGFEALDSWKDPVDIVALFDVIEHLADPIAELRRCARVLRPGGILVLQTQDLDSWARRLLGRRWPHFKQLEHVYHFDRRTLAELLRRSGFEPPRVTRRGAGKYVAWVDVADRAHRVVGIPRILCRPMRALGRRGVYLNLGDEMLAWARRPASGGP